MSEEKIQGMKEKGMKENRRKRIIIIADSMAMPRAETRYEETWPYLLGEEYSGCEFINRTERGATSMRLIMEGGGGVDLLEMYEPDQVVMQVGMAEAAPRLFRKTGWEYYIVSRVLSQGLRTRYIQFIKKTRGRRPDITDVSPDMFRFNLNHYFKRAEKLGVKVTVIKIMRSTSLFLSKSPHGTTNVDLYNGILEDTCAKFPNVETMEPFDDSTNVNEITVDEFHLSIEGHQILFERIMPYLE